MCDIGVSGGDTHARQSDNTGKCEHTEVYPREHKS